MFKNREDFIQGAKDGLVKEIVLVEYGILDGGDCTTAPHPFRGMKRKISSINEQRIGLKGHRGDESFIELDDEETWEFAGHKLTLTTNSTKLTYVINPIM